jgi:predicted ATP-dependent endonuclease of OLD family
MSNDSTEILFDKIKESIAVSDEQIQKNILTQYLRTEFDNQITHINQPDQHGFISLTIKNSKLDADIYKNECVNYSDNIGILYKAFYIETPLIIDVVGKMLRHYYPKYSHQFELLQNLREKCNENNLVEAEIVKQKSEKVLSSFDVVTCGEFKKTEFGLGYQECGLEKPLAFKNVSAGMKMFLIIKRLLENGELKEQNVLIFDEPEIHLHPEWQVEFVKLLVLLQKEFNLTILLTTHSPYFMNAIEVYVEEQNICNRCNYYMVTQEGDYYSVDDVTENTDVIYRLLAEPFHKLEKKRYE